MLRLPDGMRDRIKAKAERAGMSMNEAIVWVLEREFPAPVSLEERLEELAQLVSMLKDSQNTYAGVEDLIAEMEKTLEDVAHRGLSTNPRFSEMVGARLDYWRELQLDDWRERNESPFNDENSSRRTSEDDLQEDEAD